MEGRLSVVGGGWELRVFGGFLLRDPEGRVVRLADRKVEGLLAVLALHRDYGIERGALAEILWPGKGASGLVSLRQGLTRLRRALGADALDCSRSHCRLAYSFRLMTDCEPGVSRDDTFMPGHEGEWFDDYRWAGGVEAEAIGGPDSAVAHFQETLKWFAQNDRRGLHSLLSARTSMTRGIPYGELLGLLRMAPEDPACAGWHSYWKGTAEDNLEVCASLLRDALHESKRVDDLVLASEVCFELGKVYTRTGRLKKALIICDIADSVAEESKARVARANALRLRGTVLAHWQDRGAGLELLRRADEFVDDPIDRATNLGSRAFFEASAAEYELAARTVEDSLSLSRELGHHRMRVVSLLTSVLLKIGDGAREEAISELVPLVEHFYSVGTTQFGVYAEELLAKLLYLQGDRERANRHVVSARRAREASQMAVTRLEAYRVGNLS